MFPKLLHEDKKHVKSYSPFLPPSVCCFFFFFSLCLIEKNLFTFLPSPLKVHFAEQCKELLPDQLLNMHLLRKGLGLSVGCSPKCDPMKAVSVKGGKVPACVLSSVQTRSAGVPSQLAGKLVKVGRGKCGEPSWEHGLLPDTAWLLDCSVLLITLGLQSENLSWASITCCIPRIYSFLIL